MAFLIHSVDDGHVPAWEYLPCAAITPKVGMALTFSSGNLTTAAGTVKPGYICIASDGLRVTATTTSGVAEVVEVLDSASGGAVRIRF